MLNPDNFFKAFRVGEGYHDEMLLVDALCICTTQKGV
jgi:hypothetical protein